MGLGTVEGLRMCLLCMCVYACGWEFLKVMILFWEGPYCAHSEMLGTIVVSIFFSIIPMEPVYYSPIAPVKPI